MNSTNSQIFFFHENYQNANTHFIVASSGSLAVSVHTKAEPAWLLGLSKAALFMLE
jgi:hypothetical protein